MGKIYLIILALLGALFFGLLVHEIIHLIMFDNPISICYDIGQDTIMSAFGTYNENHQNRINNDIIPTILGYLTTIILTIFILLKGMK